MADLVSCATGMDIDGAGVIKIAKRVISLDRAIHVREGVRRKDDTPPEKLFQREPYYGYSNFNREMYNKWLDKYYELRGWNSDGIPTKEMLEEMGLDFVSQELEQREILAG